MLTLWGRRSSSCCDGLSRRSFLQVGTLGLGGLNLADVLRLQAAQKSTTKRKAVVMIYLPGGPAHQDTYDLKPNAPPEIRGEFRPICTAVPGIDICELLQRLQPKGSALEDNGRRRRDQD